MRKEMEDFCDKKIENAFKTYNYEHRLNRLINEETFKTKIENQIFHFIYTVRFEDMVKIALEPILSRSIEKRLPIFLAESRELNNILNDHSTKLNSELSHHTDKIISRIVSDKKHTTIVSSHLKSVEIEYKRQREKEYQEVKSMVEESRNNSRRRILETVVINCVSFGLYYYFTSKK